MFRWLMRDRRAFIRALLSMPAAGVLAAGDLRAASKKKLFHSARDVLGELEVRQFLNARRHLHAAHRLQDAARGSERDARGFYPLRQPR